MMLVMLGVGGVSTLYSTPISVTIPHTLNAIAIVTGYVNSAIGNAIYAAT
jgi:hypothetical protein